jgi:uncharacterized protein YecE (DUF72 family)
MAVEATTLSIGVAGWSYPDWEGVVYGRGIRERLRFLAGFVDMVEINRTFYRPPVARECAAWARQVADRPGFFFSAKIHQEVTHGGRVEPALAEAFRAGLAPLAEAGLLRHLLAQFRYDFQDTPASREHLARIRAAFGPLGPLVLELRHVSWQQPEPLAWLAELGVTVANLDYPAGPASFSLPVCTVGKDAYFRLHGRNREAWYSRDAGRDETYNYLYGPEELDGIRERMKRIKAASASLTVVANNHYQGRELVNALQLKAKEKGGRIPVPPALQIRYPVLKEIADAPVELF